MRISALLAASLALSTLLMLSLAPRAAAATPTPTATATPTATPFPPGATVLRIHIINDLNRNGARDPGEPGVAGWRVSLGCGDAFSTPGLTDAAGAVATTLRGSERDGVISECVHIEWMLGWLPTSRWWQTVDIAPGAESDITFMVHDLGRNVMEASVSVVVRGIPVSDPQLTLAPPFDGCVERIDGLRGLLIIVDGGSRPGCPSAGDTLTMAFEGEHAGTIAFAPGTRAHSNPTFVIGGDSMRFSVGSNGVPGTWEVDSARIDGRECAVIAPHDAFPVGIAVYVLSDEARPGCGRPGSMVRLYRNGAALAPTLEWRAGWVTGEVAVLLDGLHVITPPNTGSGVPPVTPFVRRAALLLSALGAMLAAAGFVLRNRRPRTL